MDKVYIIRVHGENYFDYEDHCEWDFNYKAFSTKEKAEEWLANMDKHIEEIYRYDITVDDPNLPVSFERSDDIYGICTYTVWIGDKEMDDEDYWNYKHDYKFRIEEMEVDEFVCNSFNIYFN